MRKIALIFISILTVFAMIGVSTPAQAAAKKKITNTVSVPSLKTSAKIDTRYGGIKRGAMTVPNNINFAMYKYGAKPGDRRGTVVLASHINQGLTRGGKLLKKKGGGRTFHSNIILEYAPVK